MYVRLFRHVGYESILEGEVIQTGVGFVYKRKMTHFKDLFRLPGRKKKSLPAKDVPFVTMNENNEKLTIMTLLNRLSTIALPMFALIVAVSVASCSTTSRLGKDDLLYTGIKKIEYLPKGEGKKVPSEVRARINDAVDVHPNNYIGLIGMRSPLPVGLWVYNHWNPPKKGWKRKLYDKLVEEPVLVSDVRPQLRVKMIENELADNGYFNNSASYELVHNKKNSKKAKISYTVTPGAPYLIVQTNFFPTRRSCITRLILSRDGCPILRPACAIR